MLKQDSGIVAAELGEVATLVLCLEACRCGTEKLGCLSEAEHRDARVLEIMPELIVT